MHGSIAGVHAIVVDEAHSQRPMTWQRVPDPVPGAGEVLVDVQATAVNRADLMQRAGAYPPPPGAPPYLGLEVAGRVRSLGAQVRGWQAGDRVCGIVSGGGYAQMVCVPAGSLMPVPQHLTLIEAAAVPEVFLTAYVNLFVEAGVAAGERVLVHGGASGVGTAAIQLLKRAGAWVAVTARSPEKLLACSRLGADLVIDHTQQDFAAQLAGEARVDVVLDMVGADYLQRNLAVLRTCGRVVFISLLSGGAAQLDLGLVLGRRLRLIGSLLRSRSVQEKAAITTGFAARFLPDFRVGGLAPVIHTVLPIQEAAAGHQLLTDYANVGKVVLQVAERDS